MTKPGVAKIIPAPKPPRPLQPVRPPTGAPLEEKCAWMRAKQAAKEAARGTRHE